MLNDCDGGVLLNIEGHARLAVLGTDVLGTDVLRAAVLPGADGKLLRLARRDAGIRPGALAAASWCGRRLCFERSTKRVSCRARGEGEKRKQKRVGRQSQKLMEENENDNIHNIGICIPPDALALPAYFGEKNLIGIFVCETARVLPPTEDQQFLKRSTKLTDFARALIKHKK